MDKYKFKMFFEFDEGFKFDFKQFFLFEIDGEKKEFVKDVIVIVNLRGGRGYIIFGVEDKIKRIVGIKDENIFEEKIQ